VCSLFIITERFIWGATGQKYMLQYILLGISFITIWLTIVWLHFMYQQPMQKKLTSIPTLTIAIPAYNEENTICKTVRSVCNANYPKDKLQVIVVNDGSTDNTEQAVQTFIKKHPDYPVKLISKVNGGKASALNTALAEARGEFFACVDADSTVSKQSIHRILPHFTEEKVGAVISRIRVASPKNFLERVQRFEYLMSSMIRNIMTNFGTLSVTPGVLSIYRLNVLKELGGFTQDPHNLTEDLEIALRLRANNYEVVMEPKATTYTSVPKSIGAVWRQRIRWARGYLYNHWQYRHLFFSKKQGVFGMFQLPVNVVALILLIVNITIITYGLLSDMYEWAYRSITIPNYFWDSILSFPTWKEFLLARNMHVSIPVFIIFLLGIFLIWKAHKMFKERAHQVPAIIAYVLVVPYFTTLNWIYSITHELRRTKRKW